MISNMRVSEMYLVRAEALARQSQFGPAAADIAILRAAEAVSIHTRAYGSLLKLFRISLMKDDLNCVLRGIDT